MTSEAPPFDINARALFFVSRLLRLARALPDARGAGRIADQMIRSAGAIGANLEEARAASSRREFLRVNEIALRESREATFWLRACIQSGLAHGAAGEELLDEAEQISRIIGRIVVTTKRNGV